MPNLQNKVKYDKGFMQKETINCNNSLETIYKLGVEPLQQTFANMLCLIPALLSLEFEKTISACIPQILLLGVIRAFIGCPWRVPFMWGRAFNCCSVSSRNADQRHNKALVYWQPQLQWLNLWQWLKIVHFVQQHQWLQLIQ